MSIRIDILGAGREIGRSCVIVTFGLEEKSIEDGARPCSLRAGICRVMFDCGVHFGQKLVGHRYPDFRKWLGVKATTSNAHVGRLLDARLSVVLITHFHLDHVGALPYLLHRVGFRGKVICTPPTKGLCPLLLADFLRNEVELLATAVPQSLESRLGFATPQEAVAKCVNQMSIIHLGQVLNFPAVPQIEKAQDDDWSDDEEEEEDEEGREQPLVISESVRTLKITTFLGGHVLGAVMFHVEWAGMTCLYSGDFNTNRERLLAEASVPTLLRPDVLISEATYAIHSKDNRNAVEREMAYVMLKHLRSGGKVLVPCLAVGKAQEIAACLLSTMRESDLRFPLYIGGHLTERANAKYRLFSEWSRCNALSRETMEHCDTTELSEDVDWFGSRFSLSSKLVDNIQHIERDMDFLKNSTPGVLFASPAMVSGGLSLRALSEWANDPKNLVVMTGSCVTGSIGNKLVVGSKSIQTPNKATIQINCKVRYFPFANHSGHFGLKRLIEQIDPHTLVLVHGDAPGCFTLGYQMSALHGLNVWAPANYESFNIDVARCRARQNQPPQTSQIALLNPHLLTPDDDGVPIFLKTSTGISRQLVTRQFYQRVIHPHVSVKQLLTAPKIWPGITNWLNKVLTLSVATKKTKRVREEDDEEEEEEGCLTDDEEAVQAIPASEKNYADLFHRQMFLRLLSEKGESEKCEEIAMSPSEEFLAGKFRAKRFTVRITAWLYLAHFRDFIFETEKSDLQDFAYFEEDGFGLACVHALGLVILVSTTPQSREALIKSHDDQIALIDLEDISYPLPKLLRETTLPNHEQDADFITPCLIQIGKIELGDLVSCARTKTDAELSPAESVWRRLGKILLSRNKLQSLGVSETKPVSQPSPEITMPSPPPPNLWRPIPVDDWTRFTAPPDLPPPPSDDLMRRPQLVRAKELNVGVMRDEEVRRLMKEEERLRMMKEEETRRRMQEEETRRRMQEEETRRRMQEEETRRRMQEEETRRRMQEEETRRRMQDEEMRRRMQEEEETRRLMQEEETRRQMLMQEAPRGMMPWANATMERWPVQAETVSWSQVRHEEMMAPRATVERAFPSLAEEAPDKNVPWRRPASQSIDRQWGDVGAPAPARTPWQNGEEWQWSPQWTQPQWPPHQVPHSSMGMPTRQNTRMPPQRYNEDFIPQMQAPDPSQRKPSVWNYTPR